MGATMAISLKAFDLQELSTTKQRNSTSNMKEKSYLWDTYCLLLTGLDAHTLEAVTVVVVGI